MSYSAHVLRSLLFLVMLALSASMALTGCSSSNSSYGGGSDNGQEDGSDDDGGNDEGDGSGAEAGGSGQKGPYQPGGTAEATELNTDGTPGSGTASGSIDTDGQFEISGVDWSGPTEIELSGTFFDETTGNFSSDTRNLIAVESVDGDSIQTNVNLYTHFAGHRVLYLMSDGEAFADAYAQAENELGNLVDIASNPGELDLADAGGGPEDDGTNLLLFSAAVLSAGLDQAGIDAIAADFADDGDINGSATQDGDGQSHWQAVQQAAEDPGLLDTVRQNISNQYGTTPPNGDTSGLGWLLDPCTAASLSEPRVVCDDLNFDGNHFDDSGEFVTFIPSETGHYTIELFGDANVDDDNTGSCSWVVYKSADTSSTEMGDSYNTDGFCGVEDVTKFRLTGEQTYYIRPQVSQDDDQGPDARFTLSVTRVAEGKELEGKTVGLSGDEVRDAIVGTLISTSTTSYYHFVAGTGTHTIEARGYPCGDGELRLTLYENASNGFSDQVENAWDADVCAQQMSVSLDVGQTYFLKVENYLGGFNRTSSRPAPAGIQYELEISN